MKVPAYLVPSQRIFLASVESRRKQAFVARSIIARANVRRSWNARTMFANSFVTMESARLVRRESSRARLAHVEKRLSKLLLEEKGRIVLRIFQTVNKSVQKNFLVDTSA